MIKRLNDCRRFIAADGSLLREILNPNKHRILAQYSLAWARVRPKHETIPHTLSYSEVYFILKGRGLMRIGRRKTKVRVNDTVYIPPRTVQSIKNIGSTDLEFLCIVSPAWEPSCETIIRKR